MNRKDDYDYGYRIAVSDSKQGNVRRHQLKERIAFIIRDNDELMGIDMMWPRLRARDLAERILQEIERYNAS